MIGLLGSEPAVVSRPAGASPVGCLPPSVDRVAAWGHGPGHRDGGLDLMHQLVDRLRAVGVAGVIHGIPWRGVDGVDEGVDNVVARDQGTVQVVLPGRGDDLAAGKNVTDMFALTRTHQQVVWELAGANTDKTSGAEYPHGGLSLAALSGNYTA